MGRLMTVTMIGWLLLVAGCASGSKPASESSPAQPRPKSTATIVINTPASGAVVEGTTLRVRINLSGGRIVPQTSTNITPTEGHIHLLVDGKVVSMTYGVEQDVTVTKGRHLLEAEFVAADHFPFNPRVLSSVVFTSQ